MKMKNYAINMIEMAIYLVFKSLVVHGMKNFADGKGKQVFDLPNENSWL